MKTMKELLGVEQAKQDLQTEEERLRRAENEAAEAKQAHDVAQAAYDTAAHRHFMGEISAEAEDEARTAIERAQQRIERIRRAIPIQQQAVADKREALAEAKRCALPAIIAAGQAEMNPLLDRLFTHYEEVTALREQMNEILTWVQKQCASFGDSTRYMQLNMGLLPRIEAWNKRTGKHLCMS